MRSFRVAFLLSQSTRENTDAAAIKQEILEEINLFESTLRMLEEGNPVRPLFLPKEPEVQQQMKLLHQEWTEKIKPLTDLEQYGVIEKWTYPDSGYGDCEDYVLLKRKALMQLGWPREALLITVVRDKKGDGHSVLTVRTDKGEFILDNQVEEILPWADTGYRFVKRQSQADPNIWIALGDQRPTPFVAAR
jgi:predicted transglutaminase-like cysteine proteinase